MRCDVRAPPRLEQRISVDERAGLSLAEVVSGLSCAALRVWGPAILFLEPKKKVQAADSQPPAQLFGFFETPPALGIHDAAVARLASDARWICPAACLCCCCCCCCWASSSHLQAFAARPFAATSRSCQATSTHFDPLGSVDTALGSSLGSNKPSSVLETTARIGPLPRLRQDMNARRAQVSRRG